MTERPKAQRLIVRALAVCLALGVAAGARAQLKIEITSGVTDPIPIAVVPFAGEPAGATDVAQVVQEDLGGSGRFRAMPRAQMAATPAQVADVVDADWRASGNDYVVIGRISPLGTGQYAVDFDLINVLTGEHLADQRFTGAPSALRDAAHRISDVIYQKILGIRGAFATRIAYVAVDGKTPTQLYRLVVADSDGMNPRVILESHQPIMSPAWSPNGQWIAYVLFEHHHSTVYVQKVRTGERRRVSARVGGNSSPAWSPDGKRLAVTLSGKDGNSDIYILDLTNQQLTRITTDDSIDTEAVWAPDGQSLYFTSDRAGSPQIYKIGTTPGSRPRRITFGSTYAARARISPDGTKLAMVTLDDRHYRIAVQDLANGTVRVLSHGNLDESPSFAPNGASLIYSNEDNGVGVLETVAVDGLTGRRLSAAKGGVREPAWGPFEH